MPLPTSIPVTSEAAFQQVLFTAQSVSSNLRGVRDLINNNGPVLMDNLIGLYQVLNSSRDVGLTIQGVEGLTDYAKTALNDPTYDIDSAFMTSVIACKAVTDHLLTAMPSDGNSGFIGWRVGSDGKIDRVIVDVTTLGQLRDLIDAALATFA